MSKEVQMSIKMKAELRDEFMTVAAMRYRPAAQIIRELMRLYIAQSHKAEEVFATVIPSAILD
jgi:predicted DNA-binding protein